MAINPMIPLGVRSAPIETPSEGQARALTLRQLMQARELGDLQLEQARQGMADERATREAFAAGMGPDGKWDEEKTLQGLAQSNPKAFLQLQEQMRARRKMQLEEEGKRLEVLGKRAEMSARLAGGVLSAPPEQREQAYQQARRQAIQWGLSDGSDLPEVFDEGLMQRAFMGSMSAKEQIDAQYKALAEKRATEEHEASLPGKKADSEIKQTQAGQVKQYGMPLNDRVRLDADAADRAERWRHNRTTENFQRENIVLDRGRLGETRRHNQVTEETGRMLAGGIMKPLSGDQAKVVSIANTMLPELEELKKAYNDNYEDAVWGIVSGRNGKLKRLADQVADKVGRLRSGGAINKQEEERFMGQIASWQDLYWREGDKATRQKQAIEALEGVAKEAEEVLRNMNRGGAGGNLSNLSTEQLLQRLMINNANQ